MRAARTYSAAADRWNAPALGLWDRFGAATVARVGLKPGDVVLDLCCGAGASALPAAGAVGSTGRVVAVDLAEPLLTHGRSRAAAKGLDNVNFRCADARATGLPSAAFDARYVEALDSGQRAAVRGRVLTELAERRVARLRTDVVFAIARRDDQPPLESADASASSAGI